MDGNKRTAAVACETLIELNDGRLDAEDAELFPRYLALAEGKLTLEEFATWLRTHLQTVPKGQVQEKHPRRARKLRRRVAA